MLYDVLCDLLLLFFDLILPRFCGLHPGIPLAV